MAQEPGAGSGTPEIYDAAVVGAGFGGLYALYRLRALGFSAVAFEAGSDVGGTWYWNRYPGARCDVESIDYSYGFSPELEQDWTWTDRYATQPEILDYARHVAERFDLRRFIRFSTRVTEAHFDEGAGLWRVRTDRGEALSARFCIMATGCLSAAKMPEIPGLDSFRGRTFHTGRWPHEPVDFTGRRVGVIGTGSSGIQAIPRIAEQAAALTVFQRTANFSIPARRTALEPGELARFKADYPAYREKARRSQAGVPVDPVDHGALEVGEAERQATYEGVWLAGGVRFMRAFNDLAVSQAANDTAAEFVRGKIRSTVRDPAVAELLAPKDHPIGTKRICVDVGYYETYNRDNVRLVDLRRTPIVEVTPAGVRTTGEEHPLDDLVLATGFDAMTGALLAIDIRGRDGRRLADAWAAGPVSYLGLMVAGFPNLFTVTGPGSPSVLINMIVAVEQHLDWITQCMDDLRRRGVDRIEADAAAQEAWVRHVNETADLTLFPRTASWYVGANVPGKPRVFMPYMGGLDVYDRKCREVRQNGYEGFTLGG